ncbi:hypothetical protein MTR_3g100055 [Medicago truncatula]|uniref:Uncharacterized protein n=1 Tax=Medicago truncatula TaxID=3880 RepID=A0A072VC29_MEDTR|nr:hypothetical protein MTR_3g100055 [Medicago truncatula]
MPHKHNRHPTRSIKEFSLVTVCIATVTDYKISEKSHQIFLSNVKTLSSPGLILIIETVAPLQKLDADSKSNWVDESRF